MDSPDQVIPAIQTTAIIAATTGTIIIQVISFEMFSITALQIIPAIILQADHVPAAVLLPAVQVLAEAVPL